MFCTLKVSKSKNWFLICCCFYILSSSLTVLKVPQSKKLVFMSFLHVLNVTENKQSVKRFLPSFFVDVSLLVTSLLILFLIKSHSADCFEKFPVAQNSQKMLSDSINMEPKTFPCFLILQQSLHISLKSCSVEIARKNSIPYICTKSF